MNEEGVMMHELGLDELRVYYRIDERISHTLDHAIEDVLSALGYRRWASGLELGTGVRDLAFERTGEGDE